MSPVAISRFARIAVGILLGVAIGLGANYYIGGDRSLVPQAISVGGPFALTDQNGQRRTEADFRGKLMLLTFGYTSCPDVCPLDLQLMADALDKVGPQADAIQPVFISFDPRRDTVEQLREYLPHFSPRFVGLTGSEADVAAAAKAYRVYYKANGDPAKNPNYTMDHSAFIYLMGRDGRFLSVFTPDTPPERMAEALRKYL
jgi:protein SCO1/2